MVGRVLQALRRCRPFALSIFLAYVVSCSVGILMAHSGSTLALEQRDRIVKRAISSDKSSIAYRSGDRLSAVIHDFAGNLFLGALPQAVGGLAVFPPYLSVAYQGWVGGIVSVDGKHRSRFRSAKATGYYFLVLLLQFIPYSLTIGAGVRCGVDLYRSNANVDWRFWRDRIPRETLVDAGCVLAVAVPLFLLASAFEFLSTWNI